MKSQKTFTECPSCRGNNLQTLGAGSWFCLDCDWDDLSPVAQETDALISALRHGDRVARREAAQVLINVGNTEQDIASSTDLQPLLDALFDEDDDVRYFATVALGKLGEPGALAKLKQIAQSDSSQLVRQGAMVAIERLTI